MGVGACVISNEGTNVKDALLQARIEGKSWKQIGEEFGYGSPSAARTAFKKITGVQDFKIKGKALKNIVDQGLIDELKTAVPKKPPVAATGEAAPGMSANATQGAQGSFGSQTATLGDDLAQYMKQAFPGQPNKLVLQNQLEVEQVGDAIGLGKRQAAQALREDVLDDIGFTKYEAVLQDIKAGKYYSDIVSKHGVSFGQVDATYWADALDVAASVGSPKRAVWKAYKEKPTSEYGFKAVQDTVWDLKKLGADTSQIVNATGIDENVVKLILKNEWSLPGKGSKQYVGYPQPSYGINPSSSSSQTMSQIIGESNNFADMTKAQADNWVQALGQDLSSEQFDFYRRYTGSFYNDVNSHLRSGSYVDGSGTVDKGIRAMKEGMKPIPENVTLHRGVGREAFPSGNPVVGDAYMDPGFMSTSFGNSAAFSSKPWNLIIDAPVGTKARPLHQLSGFKGENEILLDAGTKFVITGVRGRDVFLRVVL